MRKASKDNLETIEWLAGIRWKGLPVCVGCNKKNTSKLIKTRGMYQCNNCRKQYSVFSGTRFEGTRLSPFKLASAIIYYWKESSENVEEVLSDKKIIYRWRGVIGVRDLERAIGTYSTAQRLHKKLISIPFERSITLDQFVGHLLKT